MSKIDEFLQNEHIQGSLISGLCIIALAVFFKPIMHMSEVPYLENSAPGFVYTIWEASHEKIKSPFWRQIEIWNALQILLTAIIMIRHLV